MFRFLARRLLLTIPVFFGVATVVFLLIHLIPGDPVQAMLGESAAPADIAVLRDRLGLDRPLIVQYGAFLEGLVTGDLGTSLRTNQTVVSALAERLPATVELAAAAMLVALVFALPMRHDRRRPGRHPSRPHDDDRAALVGISMPNFWLGPLLAIVFSIVLGWLPVSGRGTPAHLILPCCHAGGTAGGRPRQDDPGERVLEELRELCVLAARARGVSRARAVLKLCFSQ